MHPPALPPLPPLYRLLLVFFPFLFVILFHFISVYSKLASFYSHVSFSFFFFGGSIYTSAKSGIADELRKGFVRYASTEKGFGEQGDTALLRGNKPCLEISRAMKEEMRRRLSRTGRARSAAIVVTEAHTIE
jgi:hypothetical protein